ncbi:hypothetical protein [Nodosilinea sp. E11]|uniref:hypothetical protein n=1 Tax=Nodosilinea sp. E11 TaxID=3037479 RepID=UPI002934FFE7|nr:hypothetical protein [Nodosilinea sp. E11]WOD41602.1 hypothetical protein RRF56_12430 [Nodosilinea sp. E11]
MNQRSQFALAVLSILATAALAATAVEAGPGQGREHRLQPGASVAAPFWGGVPTP